MDFSPHQLRAFHLSRAIVVLPARSKNVCRRGQVVKLLQISKRGSRLSEGAQEFSGFLKTYIANWAGTSVFSDTSSGIDRSPTGTKRRAGRYGLGGHVA
jgi:hypothetical protein